ncbi:MAG: DUF2974 domain-containing protein [Oscillospiraceae bacterium]|nr:DUF2974 domain-containing protein [Oscillospiraceae bacterium]
MFDFNSFRDWKADYDSGRLRKKDEIEKLLKRKYGKKFSVFSYISCTGVVYADKWGVVSDDNERFRVESQDDDDGYSDNYYSILLRKELSSKVKSCLEQEFSDFDYNLSINSRAVTHNSFSTGNDFTLYAKLFVTLNGGLPDDVQIKKILESLNSKNIRVWSKWTHGSDSVICYLKNDGTLALTRANKNRPAIHPLRLDELSWLASIVYLDELTQSQNGDDCSLGETAAYIKDFVFPLKPMNTRFPVELTKGQWIDILKKIIDNPLVSSLKITKIIDVNELNHLEYPDIYIGHRAVNFSDSDGNCYAVFRGTCGDLEWYDNAVGMLAADTKQQRAAVSFLRELKGDKDIPIKTLTVVGHSKGGNKAQYAFLTTESGFIDRCVSINGQGFSNEFLLKYSNRISNRQDKLELNAERRDFVNCLCNWVGKTTYYSGWRGQSVPGLKYGYGLPFFHCSDSLYDWNGNFADYGKTGAIPEMVNHFILHILNDEKYSEIKETTILEIISLMMIDRKTTNRQIAGAFFNLTLIFSDLINNDKEFCEKVKRVFKEEEKTLLATFEMLEHEGGLHKIKEKSPIQKNREPSIISYYMECLTLRFFKDNEFRKDLNKTLKFFSTSVISEVRSELAHRVEDFIAGIIGGISKKTVHYSTDVPLNRRLNEIRKSFDTWRLSKSSKTGAQTLKTTFEQFLEG